MKKLKAIAIFVLLAIGGDAMAQNVSMTTANVVIEAGKTADMVVSLENTMDIAGWQMILHLPAGITLPYEEEDGERYYDATVSLSSRHLRSHICTVTETADGGWLIMAYNPNKPTAIKEHSGELVTITLLAADTYSGEQTATISNIAVADLQGSQTSVEGGVSFTIRGNSETSIYTPSIDKGDKHTYDLSGRRVQEPIKGVYIVNGQKTAVK